MIRNAQIRFNQNQNFEGKDLIQVGSIALEQNNSPQYSGQLKRGTNNELIYVHPTQGPVVIVDSTGNIGNVNIGDKFLQAVINNTSTATIIHNFGRPALVRIFEGNSESDCSIIYPLGEENSKVIIESNVPITATVYLN